MGRARPQPLGFFLLLLGVRVETCHMGITTISQALIIVTIHKRGDVLAQKCGTQRSQSQSRMGSPATTKHENKWPGAISAPRTIGQTRPPLVTNWAHRTGREAEGSRAPRGRPALRLGPGTPTPHKLMRPGRQLCRTTPCHMRGAVGKCSASRLTKGGLLVEGDEQCGPTHTKRSESAGHSEQAHVSTRKASSVVPWAPFGSAVTTDWISCGPTENTVSS